MKRLCLPGDLREKICRHCAEDYPREACGLLIGGPDFVVREIVPSPNLSPHPRKNFEIDPALIIEYQKKLRDGTERILGHYHSHPEGRAAPSIHDQAQNHDSRLTWLIVQVTDGCCRDIAAFATEEQAGSLTAIPLIRPLLAGTV